MLWTVGFRLDGVTKMETNSYLTLTLTENLGCTTEMCDVYLDETLYCHIEWHEEPREVKTKILKK